MLAERIGLRRYARFYLSFLVAAVLLTVFLLVQKVASSLTASIVSEKEANAEAPDYRLSERIVFEGKLNFVDSGDTVSTTKLTVATSSAVTIGYPVFSNIDVPLGQTASTTTTEVDPKIQTGG